MLRVSPTSLQSAARVGAALAALRAGVTGRARLDGLVRGAALVEQAAKHLLPRGPDTDPPHTHLADTVGVRVYDASGAVARVGVGTDDPRGEMVEFGTRPHVIVPRRAGALYWRGAAHPVGRVQHPGTRPHPWLRPAGEQTIGAVAQSVGDAITRAARDGRGGGA